MLRCFAACGLYFVAELAEEHPSKFKKFLHYSSAVCLCWLCFGVHACV